jgi:hypothetical protein
MHSGSDLEKDVNAAVERKNTELEKWQLELLRSFEFEK